MQLILHRAEANVNADHISAFYEELVFEAPAYYINITQKSPAKYGEKIVQRDTDGKSSWHKCTGRYRCIEIVRPIAGYSHYIIYKHCAFCHP